MVKAAVKENPNAAVAASVTGAAGVVSYLADLVGLNGLPTPVAIWVAGGITTVALWVGRDGVKGVLGRVWRGRK